MESLNSGPSGRLVGADFCLLFCWSVNKADLAQKNAEIAGAIHEGPWRFGVSGSGCFHIVLLPFCPLPSITRRRFALSSSLCSIGQVSLSI